MMNVNIESREESVAGAKYSETSRSTKKIKSLACQPFVCFSEKTARLESKSCILLPIVTLHSFMESHEFLALEELRRWKVGSINFASVV